MQRSLIEKVKPQEHRKEKNIFDFGKTSPQISQRVCAAHIFNLLHRTTELKVLDRSNTTDGRLKKNFRSTEEKTRSFLKFSSNVFTTQLPNRQSKLVRRTFRFLVVE